MTHTWWIRALPSIVHELGHALAFRIAGVRVRLVRIGRGKVLRELRFRKTKIELRTTIDAGEVFTPSRTRIPPDHDQFISLAGPCLEFLFGLAAMGTWLLALVPAAALPWIAFRLGIGDAAPLLCAAAQRVADPIWEVAREALRGARASFDPDDPQGDNDMRLYILSGHKRRRPSP